MDDGLHRRLTTWWLAIDLADGVYTLLSDLPRGHADMRSQATRAADSIASHIAEGAKRISRADKANRFRIALGELGEVDSVLAILDRRARLSHARYLAVRGLLTRVAAGLGGLIKRLE